MNSTRAREPEGLYRIEVDPLGYLPFSQFVNVADEPGTSLQVVLAVDPQKVKSVDFPHYVEVQDSVRALLQASGHVLGFES